MRFHMTKILIKKELKALLEGTYMPSPSTMTKILIKKELKAYLVVHVRDVALDVLMTKILIKKELKVNSLNVVGPPQSRTT